MLSSQLRGFPEHELQIPDAENALPRELKPCFAHQIGQLLRLDRAVAMKMRDRSLAMWHLPAVWVIHLFEQ